MKEATVPQCAAGNPLLEAGNDAIHIRSGRMASVLRGVGHQHQIAAPGPHALAWLHFRGTGGSIDQHRISERHVCVLPAGSVDDPAWQCRRQLTLITLSAEFLRNVACSHGMRHVELAPHYAAVDPLLWHMARFIDQQLRIRGRLEAAYLQSLANVIGLHLLDTYADAGAVRASAGGLPHYKVRRALDYIRSHYREEISFKDIAAHLDMSPFHFARMFKHSTNQSPHQYISRYRIEAAKKMLVESDRAIADVALEVGYKSQSHFTTRFALWVGLTPAAFRAGR